MSDTFNERGKGFEAKFKLDAEQVFKAEARRNRLLGEWLAEKFGLPDSERADYARTIVIADMEEPGIEDVMRTAMADIAAHSVDISEADVRAKISELDAVAARQIAGE